MEGFGGEALCKSVEAKSLQGDALLLRTPGVYTPQVSRINNTQNTSVELEGDVDMDAVFLRVGPGHQIARIPEQYQVAIKAEVHLDQAPIEFQEQIFAEAGDISDLPAACHTEELIGGLRTNEHRMEYMDAANCAFPHDGI